MGVRVSGVQTAILAVVLVTLGVASGCASSGPPQDPIERAMRITELKKSAVKHTDSFQSKFDLHVWSQKAKDLNWNPDEISLLMGDLKAAEKDLQEAVALDSRARGLVFQLGTVLQYQSVLLGLKFANLDGKGERAKARGEVWSAAQQAQVDAARVAWEDKVREANVQYRYFSEQLISGALPGERQSVLWSLYRNYQMLEDWQSAANLGRVIIDHIKLTDEARTAVGNQIEQFEELHLRKQMQDEERSARGS